MCVWAAEASTQHILLCFAASAAFSPETSLCGVPVLCHRIMISITCYQIISLPLFNVVCKSPVTWEVSTEIQACTSTAVGSHKQILCQLVLDCNSKLGSLKTDDIMSVILVWVSFVLKRKTESDDMLGASNGNIKDDATCVHQHIICTSHTLPLYNLSRVDNYFNCAPRIITL